MAVKTCSQKVFIGKYLATCIADMQASGRYEAVVHVHSPINVELSAVEFISSLPLEFDTPADALRWARAEARLWGVKHGANHHT